MNNKPEIHIHILIMKTLRYIFKDNFKMKYIF